MPRLSSGKKNKNKNGDPLWLLALYHLITTNFNMTKNNLLKS